MHQKHGINNFKFNSINLNRMIILRGLKCIFNFLWIFSFHQVHSQFQRLRVRQATFSWDQDPPNIYRSYQKTIYCNASSEIQEPENISSLLKIIQKAIKERKTLKVVGSRHSLTDIICTEGIPISLRHFNHTHLNEDGSASFGAGIEMEDALKFLSGMNRTLIHVPAYSGITIGGSIGTGAHGSSLLHPTTISDQIIRMQIVDGLGTLQNITDPEELNGFRVHLGLLGILVEVTLATVPLFKMRVETHLESETILTDGTAVSLAHSYDWFQMWWFPSTSNVVVLKGDYLEGQGLGIVAVKHQEGFHGNATSQFIPSVPSFVITGGHIAYEALQDERHNEGLHALEKFTELSLHSEVDGKPPLFSEDGVKRENPAEGLAWKLLSNRCSPHCPWENGDSSILPEESSIGIEMSELPHVIHSIRDILGQTTASFPMVGIFIRFSKPSSSLMGISSGRPTITLEWTTPMRTNPFTDARNGAAAYQAILQTMVHKHNGRPHWGKNGLLYFSPEVISKSFPNLSKFQTLMKKFDPNGIFQNKFGRRLLNLSKESDVDPRVTHCALQDYCVCSKNEDCSSKQSCVKLNGFNVCRDLVELNPKSDYDPKNFTSIILALGVHL